MNLLLKKPVCFLCTFVYYVLILGSSSDGDSSELEVIEEIPLSKSKKIKNPYFDDRSPRSWKEKEKLTKYKCAVTFKCQQCKCGYRFAGSKSTTAKKHFKNHSCLEK